MLSNENNYLNKLFHLYKLACYKSAFNSKLRCRSNNEQNLLHHHIILINPLREKVYFWFAIAL